MALYFAIASIRISKDKQVLENAWDFTTEKGEAFMELSKRLVNSLLEPVDREEERFFRFTVNFGTLTLSQIVLRE